MALRGVAGWPLAVPVVRMAHTTVDFSTYEICIRFIVVMLAFHAVGEAETATWQPCGSIDTYRNPLWSCEPKRGSS